MEICDSQSATIGPQPLVIIAGAACMFQVSAHRLVPGFYPDLPPFVQTSWKSALSFHQWTHLTEGSGTEIRCE